MSRLQLIMMIFAGVSVIALLVVTMWQDRATKLALYAAAVVLLVVGAGLLIVFEKPYTDDLNHANLLAGVYFLLLAIAPAWAAINVLRRP